MSYVTQYHLNFSHIKDGNPVQWHLMTKEDSDLYNHNSDLFIEWLSNYAERLSRQTNGRYVMRNLKNKKRLADIFAVQDALDFFDGTWYDHEMIISRLSRLWPCLGFVLQGNGEDWDDVWEKTFVRGLICESRAVMSIAVFDPINLRKPRGVHTWTKKVS